MFYFFKFCIISLQLMLMSSWAVASAIKDMQSWWNITALGTFHKDNQLTPFKYWLEGQQRLGDYSRRSSQTILRPGLGYALNGTTSIWLGYALIDTDIPFTQVSFYERRIWQQLLWIKNYSHLTLSSRTRLEERFLANTPPMGWRLREMLKMTSPISKRFKLNIVGSNEIFWHLNNFFGQNNNGFDQNRFFIGLGFKIDALANVELGYLNQFIYRRQAPNFWSNNLSTTLFLQFS